MRSAPKKKRESGALKEVWQAHNELVDFVRETAPMPSSGTGVIVTRTSNGTLFKVATAEAPGASGEVVRMLVTAVFDDHLQCTRIDDGSSVDVAKPFNLRKTGWHGVTKIYRTENYPGGNAQISITYTYVSATYRTAAIGTVVEHQAIRPFYLIGFSEIFASSCDGSGVTAANEWVDINADGRAWTMVI